MRLLVLTHPDSRDPGLAGERAEAAGARLDRWCAGAGEEAPGDPAAYDALVVLGGGTNVKDAPRTPWLRDEIRLVGDAVRAGTPVLGICLGAQILAEATGGRVIRSPEPEIGWYDVRTTGEAAGDPVFGELPERFEAYQWHSYAVEPPPGAVPLASNPTCVQAYRVGASAYGVQFHPEVTPAILGQWIPDYPTDPDAARVGGDPAAALAAVPEHLPAWNAVGRRLFDGWLALVARAAAQRMPASSRSPLEPAT
jgi:GMP synthase-like glutamine amidotransferase